MSRGSRPADVTGGVARDAVGVGAGGEGDAAGGVGTSASVLFGMPRVGAACATAASSDRLIGAAVGASAGASSSSWSAAADASLFASPAQPADAVRPSGAFGGVLSAATPQPVARSAKIQANRTTKPGGGGVVFLAIPAKTQGRWPSLHTDCRVVAVRGTYARKHVRIALARRSQAAPALSLRVCLDGPRGHRQGAKVREAPRRTPGCAGRGRRGRR